MWPYLGVHLDRDRGARVNKFGRSTMRRAPSQGNIPKMAQIGVGG